MLHSLQYGKYLINCNFISAGALIHDALSKLYCASRKNEIANQIRDLLTEEDAPEKIHIISQYLEMLETNVDCENRQKHEDWFEGMPCLSYSHFFYFTIRVKYVLFIGNHFKWIPCLNQLTN